jgi:hypothetical protein
MRLDCYSIFCSENRFWSSSRKAHNVWQTQDVSSLCHPASNKWDMTILTRAVLLQASLLLKQAAGTSTQRYLRQPKSTRPYEELVSVPVALQVLVPSFLPSTANTAVDGHAGECLVSSFQATRQPPLHDHINDPEVTLSTTRVSHEVLGDKAPTTAPTTMLVVELDQGNDSVSNTTGGDYDDDGQHLGIVQYVTAVVHLFLIKRA